MLSRPSETCLVVGAMPGRESMFDRPRSADGIMLS